MAEPAGGGKSFIGCLWLIRNCVKYPGTRWLMGRAVLKSLKESTLKTFFEIISLLNWGGKIKYNSNEGYIKWDNGSEIMLKDLYQYPSDPNFDSLGSTEYTGAFIDEASQVSEKAKNIVASRLRFKLDEYSLVPKILIASNPAKNWMYSEFYKPFTKNSLLVYRKVVLSLATDNPNLSKHYINNLHKLDKVSKERLLYGNWDYDDDPAVLMDYDKITDIFTNSGIEKGEKYIVSDLAMMGRDKFIVSVWEGLRCKFEIVKLKSSGKEIEEDIKRTADKYQIPHSNIIVDSDGMGNYLESYLNNIKEFKGGHSATDTKKYANMRSECYFKLSEYVNQGKIFIDTEDIDIREDIKTELSFIKRDKIDNDESKLRIVKKEDIKVNLGRSPDWADVLMMRMYFELNKSSYESVDIDFLF